MGLGHFPALGVEFLVTASCNAAAAGKKNQICTAAGKIAHELTESVVDVLVLDISKGGITISLIDGITNSIADVDPVRFSIQVSTGMIVGYYTAQVQLGAIAATFISMATTTSIGMLYDYAYDHYYKSQEQLLTGDNYSGDEL